MNNMPIYDLKNIPSTHSWVKDLNASEAVEQCRAWSLEPADTLAANRAALRQFIIDHRQNQQLHSEEQVEEQLQLQHSEHHGAPSATPPHPSLSVPPALAEPHPPGHSTQNITLPDQATPTGLNDPNLQALITSLQSMTLDAIAQTTIAVTSKLNMATQFPPQPEMSKCPPLIRDLLRELPKTSGQDPQKVIHFCKDLHKIIEMQIAPDKVVLMNVLPYTTDRFREFWMTATSQNPSWEFLLQSITQNFFTPDTLRKLQNQYLYRTQAPDEQLGDYVRDMQISYRILSPTTPPSDIFHSVFRGINPVTRTTFAGLKPITSIQDLIDIAPFAHSLTQQPLESQSQPTVPNRNIQVSTHNFHSSSDNSQPRFNSSRPRNFYGQRFNYQNSGFRPQHQTTNHRYYQNQPPSTSLGSQTLTYSQSGPRQQFSRNYNSSRNTNHYSNQYNLPSSTRNSSNHHSKQPPYIPPFNVYPRQSLNSHGGGQ